MSTKKTITNLVPGTYGFSFRAIGEGNTPGEWSAVFQYTVSGDSTPPPVPSKPTATSTFTGATVTWTDPGYQLPNDFARVDVYSSEDNGPYLKFGSIFAIGASAVFSKGVAGKNYTFKLVALDTSGNGSGFSEASDPVQMLSVDIDSTPPSEISQASIATSWSGTDLVITFDKNVATDAQFYIIELTANSIVIPFTMPIQTATQQRFVLTEAQARAAFGGFYTSYTGKIKSLDKLNNATAGVSFTTATYVDTIANFAIGSNWDLTSANSGYIVSWVTTDANFYEAEVWESSTQNGTYSLVASGLSPQIVKVSGLVERWVKIRYVGKAVGSYSQYSTAKSVTPADLIVFDDTPPSNTISNTGFTITDGIDPNGKYQFAGYLDLAWTAITGDTSIRGYRIRYRKAQSTDAYTYADVPGAASSTFRLDGLLIGGTYEVGISPYDEINNVNSTYKTYPDTLIEGTASFAAGSIITAGDMEIGYGVKDSTGTTTGQEKGIWLDADDYWYIKSGQSSRFSVGSTNNKLLWDGTDLSLTGKIFAKGGSIDGNLDVISGTIRARTSNTATAKVEINSAGIQATSDGSTNTVTISSTDGSIVAKAGTIGGWTLQSDALYKPLAGMYAPTTPVNSDIAFWAGSSLANRATADFRVQYDGKVNASNLVISGGSLNINNVFKVSTAGVLEATGATITGALNVNSPSTFSSNITISGGGELKVSQDANNYVKLGSTGLVGVNAGTVKTQLTAAGYFESKLGQIGGWTISDNSIASGVVTFNSSGTGNIISVVKGGTTTFAVNQAGDVEIRGQVTILDSGGNVNNFLTEADVGASGATVISGARITTGTMSGDRITGGTITGTTISGGEFSLKNNSGTNYWNPTKFVAGTSDTYLQVFTGTGTNTITLYSRDSQSNESDSYDTGSSSSLGSIAIDQQIVVDQNSIRIQGLPGVGNGLTAIGSLINYYGTGASDEDTTRYLSGSYANVTGPYKPSVAAAKPTETYGRAARYRMIVADPYDYNTLKRGFGVYYGSRTSAPGASNGFVGDIWISW